MSKRDLAIEVAAIFMAVVVLGASVWLLGWLLLKLIIGLVALLCGIRLPFSIKHYFILKNAESKDRYLYQKNRYYGRTTSEDMKWEIIILGGIFAFVILILYVI